MKSIVLACVLLAVGVAAQQAPQEEINVQNSKMTTRTLVADVLRDSPGLCFGSTTYGRYLPGETWNLVVFCGRATCMQNKTGFFEKVDDCGPAPKYNVNCEPIAPPQDAVFPDCCPKFRCLAGVTLEYPTEAEIKEEIKKARMAHEEQQRAAEEALAAGGDPTAAVPGAAAAAPHA